MDGDGIGQEIRITMLIHLYYYKILFYELTSVGKCY